MQRQRERHSETAQRGWMESSASIARQTWELENNIVSTDGGGGGGREDPDAIYWYDEAAQARAHQEKPWEGDPHYFRRVRVSALALLKMVAHARSGGNIEVMGLMQGKTDGDAIVVMDAFALPVEGTETRVNAQADAYEYMVDYSQTNKQAGRLENVVGWYHSHPGYGCWLSGIDVSTQMLNQQFQEPFLAVVIDPTRTVSAGKVEIGAFRTYPQGYKPPDEPVSEYQTIPLNKIEDFGVHCKQYYALDITYFKSSLDSHLLDLLWNKYWVNTLSSSPLLGNRDYVAGQISDLAEKLEQAENQMAHSRLGTFLMPSQRKKEQEESQLAKITRDSSKITAEQVHGLMSQVIKDILFNSVRQSSRTQPSLRSSSGPEPMVEA
ncbi:COP9 signalosome complex subunit 5a-like isoform X1 [Ananas comosus]|uniref:COP9 signalosome complex subunit 5a-like isoform X1 n=1 Tax=Ananas comosus TaxID=4615 RepID=A0A6P5F3I3_ANACO|nr:COP9 signalosome complex subunit 5a-like isoform X1 [Ananas comosus]